MAATPRVTLPFADEDLSVPPSGALVALNAQPHSYEALPMDRLICVQGFFPLHAQLTAQNHRAVGQLVDAPTDTSLAIVHVTRSKAETYGLVAQAFDLLVPGGILVVDGAKTDGIESLLKQVKKLHPVDGQTSKAHGKVFWLHKTAQENPFADWAKALIPTANADGWITSAGVFSADGIDPGSAELAAAIKNTLKGHGADLGAGWGWLAAQALQTNDKITQLDLMEAEISALNCARQNVTDPRADFHWCDATQTGIKKRFDFIITNPPFHLSRKADPDLGRAFITTARTLLKPTGQMFLVANKQLAYEATLDAAFGRWEILSQSSQYKIIFARKPLP